MITALVLVERGVPALAVTLAALVPAVAEGLVADAVVLVRRPDSEVAKVAEGVGARLAEAGEDPWRSGAALARRDWLLCLEDGDIPLDDWARAIERFLAYGARERPLARLRRRPQPISKRVTRVWEAGFGGKIRAGDLVHRRLLEGAGRARPFPLTATIEREPAFR